MGRLPMRRGRKYVVQEIQETHHEILRRLMLGQKSVDIARDLGVSEAMVSYTKNSPLSQRQLTIMQGARDADMLDAAMEIKKMVPKAVELMNQVLSSEEDPLHLRLKVAFEVMEREAPKIQKVEGQFAHFTAEDIERIKERSRAQVVEALPMIEQKSGDTDQVVSIQ